ncbi:hypothetical protein DFH09DRAFT_1109885 [Mycena vulgaris]|nr:hypothetical protein DFH09DRAFT_1109885 [Mycena vulgaris]
MSGLTSEMRSKGALGRGLFWAGLELPAALNCLIQEPGPGFSNKRDSLSWRQEADLHNRRVHNRKVRDLCPPRVEEGLAKAVERILASADMSNEPRGSRGLKAARHRDGHSTAFLDVHKTLHLVRDALIAQTLRKPIRKPKPLFNNGRQAQLIQLWSLLFSNNAPPLFRLESTTNSDSVRHQATARQTAGTPTCSLLVTEYGEGTRYIWTIGSYEVSDGGAGGGAWRIT